MKLEHWIITFLAGFWVAIAAQKPSPAIIGAAIFFLINAAAFQEINQWFTRKGEQLAERLWRDRQ